MARFRDAQRRFDTEQAWLMLQTLALVFAMAPRRRRWRRIHAKRTHRHPGGTCEPIHIDHLVQMGRRMTLRPPIGILGTHPIHIGHLRPATRPARPRVAGGSPVPNHNFPHRASPYCSSEQRLAMVALAAAINPAGG